MKDWRNDIKEINTLEELDPIEVMIFLRHQFLESAKDLLSDDKDIGDQVMGDTACQTAETLQQAIEVWTK